MSRDVGQSWSKLYGDAHETAPHQPKAEKDMDLYNNAKGRALTSLGSDVSNTYLANKCKSLIDTHKLKRLVPRPGWTP
ncbi:hypothetical protein SAMN05421852_10685 [Thermoflavimicrobium dichotomicum]|uniref:DUF6973 domain-containing protein n=2 Tax=Thermoflavimicrobium dichotomicum TaxID=46223 RepID=A0A1I3PRD9_9BACL|nr:hypothetical protein [Thermoflavimicrobium dichotomicum]SFJ24043.1 hypothetical protein SAMN05421852_10685 [Thermoflavimicrobium dichotomicum]